MPGPKSWQPNMSLNVAKCALQDAQSLLLEDHGFTRSSSLNSVTAAASKLICFTPPPTCFWWTLCAWSMIDQNLHLQGLLPALQHRPEGPSTCAECARIAVMPTHGPSLQASLGFSWSIRIKLSCYLQVAHTHVFLSLPASFLSKSFEAYNYLIFTQMVNCLK